MRDALPTQSPPRAIRVVALVLATAVVGCGGGGDTHRQFVAHLNETCALDTTWTDRSYSDQEARLRAHDYSGATRSMRALSTLATLNWLTQRSLNPPAQDAATFAGYLEAQRQFRDVRRRLVVATRAADISEMTHLLKAEQDVRLARLKAATALGADRCWY
jgi:hypothetical protein